MEIKIIWFNFVYTYWKDRFLQLLEINKTTENKYKEFIKKIDLSFDEWKIYSAILWCSKQYGYNLESIIKKVKETDYDNINRI